MTLAEAVDAFVQQKRANGFAYVSLELQLRAFSSRVGTVQLFALAPTHINSFLECAPSPYTWRRRHAQLAEFVRYWHTHGEMPLLTLPAQKALVRPTFRPHVYTPEELRRLFGQIDHLPRNGNCTYDPETLRTLLPLLYGTGLRLSEAIALRSDSVDLKQCDLHVTKTCKRSRRKIPLGRDVSRLLQGYSEWKAQQGLTGEWYFTRRGGRPLHRDSLYDIFHKLLAQAGITRRDRLPHRPRLYDLRSSFAVHSITAWIRNGDDLNRLLPALAHYMGLQDLNATEQFLSLTPERFRKELRKLSPVTGPRWSDSAETMRLVTELSQVRDNSAALQTISL